MTAQKAVEILELNLKVADKKMPPDVRTAVLMAKVNLQRTIQFRLQGTYPIPDLLPGETED